MRITGGQYGGRRIASPPGSVRPTQDRVREAIFSSLADRIEGARVLDLFAGSGALGLEALSRGAAEVCWVEQDTRVLRTLRANLASLDATGAGRARVVRADVQAFCRGGGGIDAFDVVLADPPYRRGDAFSWLDWLLESLPASGRLRPGGILVFEAGADEEPSIHPSWTLHRDKQYGETRVMIYALNPLD